MTKTVHTDTNGIEQENSTNTTKKTTHTKKNRLNFLNPKGREAIEAYVSKQKQGLMHTISGGKGSYAMDDGIYNAKEGITTFYLKPEEVHALILYPSLCTPAVLAPGESLTVFYLINEAQLKNIRAGVMRQRAPEGSYAVSELFAYNMWTQLHVSRWRHRKKHQPTPQFKIHHRTHFKLYDKRITAIGNMAFSQPEPINPHSTDPLALIDAEGRVMGQVKPDAVSMYYDHGYRYLLRVTHQQHALNKPGLYNLAFLSLESPEKMASDPGELSPFQDDHDNLLKKTLGAYRTAIQHKYHVPKMGDFPFTLDKNDPIQAYHPVYVVDKPALGVGHLTDVHINARQHAFKKCQLQVIPDAPEEVSPRIGDLVNVSYDTLKNLMDQMGNSDKVDLLFITGDLIDFSLNWDLTGQLDKVENHQDIWDCMQLGRFFEGRGKRNTENKTFTEERDQKFRSNTVNPQNDLELTHTHGIDMTIAYSLFIYYYDTYQKPIFITSGNHDAYEAPFGISPRLLVDNIKANEGIPMDHNLTFYEAILLFGKEYGAVLNSVNPGNFQPIYANWLFQVLTPLCDFSFRYKNQTFTGLEWGDNESIAYSLAFGGGSLPRASEGINHTQLKLLSDAVKRADNKGSHYLFTHTTLINYETTIPFLCPEGKATTGKLSISEGNQGDPNLSAYNQGSFLKNQYLMYREYILNGKITHAFSGHSHRSGIYECGIHDITEYDGHMGDREYQVFKIKTKGYPIDQRLIPRTATEAREAYDAFMRSDKTRLIVTGSGGPIPCQNIQDEFHGMGLAIPSGTVLHYDASGKECFDVIYAKNPQAKPRFAVALDAFELNGNRPIFTAFEGKIYKKSYADTSNYKAEGFLTVNECLPPPTWIKEIQFFVVDFEGKRMEENIFFQANVKENNVKKFVFKFFDSSPS
ncbi:MAG: hypothetical protein RLZ35_435, partial [Pseudomonadota bacterium]